MTISLKEHRCSQCHKLLFKGILVESEIEIKCKGCGELNIIAVSKFDELLCAVFSCPHRVAVVTKKKS